MPKITVVFDYIEGAELPKRLTEAFATETMTFGDANITAISMEDEITRVEALEDGLIDNGQPYDAHAFLSSKDKVMKAAAVIAKHGREHGIRVEYSLQGKEADNIRNTLSKH